MRTCLLVFVTNYTIVLGHSDWWLQFLVVWFGE